MSVAIIDYGSGNLHSAAKAFERAAREAGLTETIAVTSDPEVVAKADRIVLPGVGAFADCRAGLAAIPGLFEAIEDRVIREGAPFLGICVGQQMMATRGLEHGETPGFGWILGDVVRIAPADPGLKVPHMGWNQLDLVREHPVLEGLDGEAFYFVHSYYPVPDEADDLLGTSEYGVRFCAAAGRENLVAVQFHPEKSSGAGLRLYENFLRWSGEL